MYAGLLTNGGNRSWSIVNPLVRRDSPPKRESGDKTATTPDSSLVRLSTGGSVTYLECLADRSLVSARSEHWSRFWSSVGFFAKVALGYAA